MWPAIAAPVRCQYVATFPASALGAAVRVVVPACCWEAWRTLKRWRHESAVQKKLAFALSWAYDHIVSHMTLYVDTHMDTHAHMHARLQRAHMA